MATYKSWLSLFGSREKIDFALSVYDRVVAAFEDHGVRVTQIPRVMPELTLADLLSPESLAKALVPEMIDKIGELFGVRTDWLECVDDQVYDSLYVNKDPQLLLNHRAGPGNSDSWISDSLAQPQVA